MRIAEDETNTLLDFFDYDAELHEQANIIEQNTNLDQEVYDDDDDEPMPNFEDKTRTIIDENFAVDQEDYSSVSQFIDIDYTFGGSFLASKNY